MKVLKDVLRHQSLTAPADVAHALRQLHGGSGECDTLGRCINLQTRCTGHVKQGGGEKHSGAVTPRGMKKYSDA
eukprot:366002-Chlamydomonas_euryale.AAC.1